MAEEGMAKYGFLVSSPDSKGNALFLIHCLMFDFPFALLKLSLTFCYFIKIVMHVYRLFSWMLGICLCFL